MYSSGQLGFQVEQRLSIGGLSLAGFQADELAAWEKTFSLNFSRHFSSVAALAAVFFRKQTELLLFSFIFAETRSNQTRKLPAGEDSTAAMSLRTSSLWTP